MGYVTDYELNVTDNELGTDDHMEGIGAVIGFNPFEDDCKWYANKRDMCQYSLLYKDVLFELRGEGEEAGDLWVSYFKNGKVQVCKAKITFDAFDENKLEESDEE